MFFNLSQPKCHTRHTNIKVLQIGQREEVYSRREDEEAESEIVVPGSFYLNMSNCRPERGHFSVITKITLQNSISKKTAYVCSKPFQFTFHYRLRQSGQGSIPLRMEPAVADVLGI